MKKIRTLLADDDYLVLKDLKNMVDWNALGFSLTETAANGKQALELAKREKPDLIVSDISMPIMDGFDFVETLKKENPGTYIIFISSYASFDYARRAMQNHIHSYLLKNEITAESLTNELLNARKNILQNELLQREKTEAALKLFFEADSGTFRDPEAECPKAIYFYLTRQMPLEKLKSHFKNVPEYGKTLYEKGAEAIRELYPESYLFFLEEFMIMALPWDEKKAPLSSTSVSITRKKIRAALKSIDEKTQIYAFPAKLSAKDGKKVYLRMLPYFHFREIFPLEEEWNLLSLENIHIESVSRPFPYECLKQSLEHEEIFDKELKNYTDLLFRSMDADGIYMLYHNLLLQMEELGGHMLPMPKQNFISDKQEFTDFFQSKFTEIRLHRHRDGRKAGAPWLDRAIDFMKKNYGDSALTIEQIAEQAGLSTSRFSVLFRQETGQTVNDYLTEIRISQAIYLLENSSLKIYEIADRVGYKSSQYFGQIFCQKTGYKPLHFRKKKP